MVLAGPSVSEPFQGEDHPPSQFAKALEPISHLSLDQGLGNRSAKRFRSERHFKRSGWQPNKANLIKNPLTTTTR
jgi:hypothetical protein